MPVYMKGNTLIKPSIIKIQSNKVLQGRKVCITVAPSPLCRKSYFTHPAGARKPHSNVGMAGYGKTIAKFTPTLRYVYTISRKIISFHFKNEKHQHQLMETLPYSMEHHKGQPQQRHT